MFQPASAYTPSIPSRTDPAAIRAALPPEKTADFDRRYAEVLAEAGATLKLTPVLEMLEPWHRMACLYLTDPAGYRRVVEIAERYEATGEAPRGVPANVTRARLKQRLVEVIPAYMELLTFLELSPWNGRSLSDDRPDANMRTQTFADGHGFVTYVIIDNQSLVLVARITWLEL